MRAVVVNQASTGIEVVDHEKPALVIRHKDENIIEAVTATQCH